ncbi:MAG: UrcA family protein [Pseudomonadota bacterium]
MLKIISFAPIALGLAVASPAGAKNAEVQIAVSYADLNLLTEEGLRALDRRLASAAEKLCGGRPDARNLAAMANFRDCMKTTKNAYEAQRLAAIEAAGEQRVAVLSNKLGRVAQR